MDKHMLFSDVDDCSICPFFADNAGHFGSDFVCNADFDRTSPPCTRMNQFKGKTLEEAVDEENHEIYSELMESYKRQEKKDAKNAKVKETRSENYGLNKSITELRRKIRKLEEAIACFERLHETMAIIREIETLKKQPNIKSVHPKEWDEQLAKYKVELNGLVAERDRRNKERRKMNRK